MCDGSIRFGPTWDAGQQARSCYCYAYGLLGPHGKEENIYMGARCLDLYGDLEMGIRSSEEKKMEVKKKSARNASSIECLLRGTCESFRLGTMLHNGSTSLTRINHAPTYRGPPGKRSIIRAGNNRATIEFKEDNTFFTILAQKRHIFAKMVVFVQYLQNNVAPHDDHTW